MQSELAMLSGWGRVRRSASVVLRPDSVGDLAQLFAGRPRAHGLIVHANGRSYGDCALNGEGTALLAGPLNTVVDFDPATGVVQAEPGVTFGQLVARFLPLGFLPPVSPGTGFATLGGAVANDVHGKNHEREGSFSSHVAWLDLLTPDGATRRIGPDAEPDLFHATCGGLGLTGIMTRVALRLKPVAGPCVAVTAQRLPELDAFLEAMDGSAGATYSVGWIDGTARGRSLGRGILETAEPSDGALPPPSGRALRIPCDFPDMALNPVSIRLFNALYYRRAPAVPARRNRRYEAFLYPLDALHGWNRIYGRRGFHQFQNVVPFASGRAALRELLHVIATSGRASFLAVLKRLGPGIGPSGPLSFPMAGYTLALDFPAGPQIESLYAELVRITLRYGGRVYLAKDALLDAASFRAMYPRHREFAAVLAAIDPRGVLQSDMSRRLRLREAA